MRCFYLKNYTFTLLIIHSNYILYIYKETIYECHAEYFKAYTSREANRMFVLVIGFTQT